MRVNQIDPKLELYIGDAEFYEIAELWKTNDWFIVQAQKEPYHRKALGYTGRGAPRDNREYLIAWRGNRMALNFIDAKQGSLKNPYVMEEMFDRALAAIRDTLHEGRKVLIHSHGAASRAPSLAMAYLGLCGLLPADFEDAVALFTETYYPYFEPGNGVRSYLALNWARYAGTAS